MKKIVSIILMFFLAIALADAQELEKRTPAPDGMEIVESGKVKVVVPKGAKVTREDGLIKVENTTEYAARKFEEMLKRMAEIEAEEDAMKEELEQLKKAMDDIQKIELFPAQLKEDLEVIEEMNSQTEFIQD